MSGWRNPPRNFGLKCLKDADTLTKKITGDMLTTVVAATPIDTSAARGNWRVGIGKVDTTADLSSRGAIAVGLPKIASQGGLGKIVYISNSLKYIERLNNGWSMQAPKNFMQISFMNVVNKYR